MIGKHKGVTGIVVSISEDGEVVTIITDNSNQIKVVTPEFASPLPLKK